MVYQISQEPIQSLTKDASLLGSDEMEYQISQEPIQSLTPGFLKPYIERVLDCICEAQIKSLILTPVIR